MRVAIVVGNSIYEYRRQFYEELGKHCEVTIFSRGGIRPENCVSIVSKNYQLFGLSIQTYFLKIIFGGFDKIIVVGNFNYLINAMLLIFGGKRVISWGFWKTKSGLANALRRFSASKLRSNIIYADSHAALFAGLDCHYVTARNTVSVSPKRRKQMGGRNLIFVGSLNERKRLDLALDLFKVLVQHQPDVRFDIVGDGPIKDKLVDQVHELNLTGSVRFWGRITSSDELARLYREAILEVSLGQAGLSVPRALGHGVPFATFSEAISGGETDSVIHGLTGFKSNDLIELCDDVIQYFGDEEQILSMRENCFTFYRDYLSTRNMVSGFLDSLSAK